MSCCNHCMDADEIFNKKMASRDLKRYRRRGPDKSTHLLLVALRKANPEGKTLLDIGGGIGAISFELFKTGLTASVHVDASTGYLDICRKEAAERGLNDSIKFVFGDFTELADDLGPADIVTLDRVVCCYPDMAKLVESSADKALKYIGLVYPRSGLLTRITVSVSNSWFRLRKFDFRTHLHPPDEIVKQIKGQGFSRIFASHTLIWEVVLYKKNDGPLSLEMTSNQGM